MGVATAEQETVINFERDSDVCTVWTSDTTMMTKLDKLTKNNDDWKLIEVNMTKGEVVSKRYFTNKSLISFRGHKVSREMTEEQRQAAADRFREMHKKKKEESNG